MGRLRQQKDAFATLTVLAVMAHLIAHTLCCWPQSAESPLGAIVLCTSDGLVMLGGEAGPNAGSGDGAGSGAAGDGGAQKACPVCLALSQIGIAVLLAALILLGRQHKPRRLAIPRSPALLPHALLLPSWSRAPPAV